MRYFGMPVKAWREGDKLHIMASHESLKAHGYPSGKMHFLLPWNAQPDDIKQAVEGKKS